MIHVMVAEDHALVRAGLKLLLQKLEGVEVVAEAGDGLDVVKMVPSIRPDIVLMDIAMPGLNGLEATARIRKENPSTRVILLSMFGSEDHLRQALDAGASGYLLKGADLEELGRAIQVVSRGDSYLTPSVAKHTIDILRQRNMGLGGPLDRLTPRQREILQLIAEGHSTKSMADRLGLSVKTVETHRAQLMERLNIHDIAGLVRFAIQVGLIHPTTT